MTTEPTARPRRRPGVEVKGDRHHLALAVDDGPEIAVNHTALALWELCDGETEVAEMVAALDQFFDADAEQIRADVLATFEQFTELGFLDWVPAS